MKFIIFRKFVEKIQVSLISENNTSVNILISHLILLGKRIVSGKVVEKIKTHLVTFSKNHAVCEKMWKNMVELDRPQVTTWRLRIACWIPKATKTHSEYVTLFAFELQQWLHEGSSVIPNMYIACTFEDNILF